MLIFSVSIQKEIHLTVRQSNCHFKMAMSIKNLSRRKQNAPQKISCLFLLILAEAVLELFHHWNWFFSSCEQLLNFLLCSALWDNSVHQWHTQKASRCSLCGDIFVFTLRICSVLVCSTDWDALEPLWMQEESFFF